MRRLGFLSDAGYRFERGVDFELGPRAVERATQLILEICGGRAGPLTDAVGSLPARAPVRLRSARVAKLLGVAISPDAIADIFTRLRLPHARSGDDFVVTPPSYRFDLAIEEDLVEEVARIYGYDAIPATPRAHVQTMLPSPEAHRSAFALRRTLVARDWQEIVTFSFVIGDDERALDPAAKPIAVLNPIAAHLDVMRTTLLPGLLDVLQTNVKRKLSRVRVFEVGRVFARDGFAQPLRIGGLAFGASEPEQWGTRARRRFFRRQGRSRSTGGAAVARHRSECNAVAASRPQRCGAREWRAVGMARRAASATRASLRIAHGAHGVRARSRGA